jgi:hypothetical protein
MLLEPQEKARFMEWLRGDIESNDMLAKQADKLGIAALAKQKRTLVMAETIVLKELQSGESFTIAKG